MEYHRTSDSNFQAHLATNRIFWNMHKRIAQHSIKQSSYYKVTNQYHFLSGLSKIINLARVAKLKPECFLFKEHVTWVEHIIIYDDPHKL
jgi:hypothetical protein